MLAFLWTFSVVRWFVGALLVFLMHNAQASMARLIVALLAPKIVAAGLNGSMIAASVQKIGQLGVGQVPTYANADEKDATESGFDLFKQAMIFYKIQAPWSDVGPLLNAVGLKLAVRFPAAP